MQRCKRFRQWPQPHRQQAASRYYCQLAFLINAHFVLETMSSNKETPLIDFLYTINTTRRMDLQWVSNHCGVPKNEVADQIAKIEASGIRPRNALITGIMYHHQVSLQPCYREGRLLPRQQTRKCHLFPAATNVRVSKPLIWLDKKRLRSDPRISSSLDGHHTTKPRRRCEPLEQGCLLKCSIQTNEIMNK